METIYFDKGTFSSLWRSLEVPARDLERLRCRLQSLYFRRRPIVVISAHLLGELAALAPLDSRGRHQFEAEVDLLRRLPGMRLLKDEPDRIAEEVRAAVEGRSADVYMRESMVHAFRERTSNREDAWAEEHAAVARSKSEFFRREQLDKQAFLADVEPSDEQLDEPVSSWAEKWFSDPESVVEGWSLTYFERARARHRLARDRSGWPDPRQVRSLWADNAYRCARLYMIFRHDRALQANDYLDAGHYRAAVHADTFVVDDKRFREIINHCPPPKPGRVLSFAEWANELLVTRD